MELQTRNADGSESYHQKVWLYGRWSFCHFLKTFLILNFKDGAIPKHQKTVTMDILSS